MSIFESVISILAPHYCISCGLEGTLLCNACQPKIQGIPQDRCYRCDRISPNSKTCENCHKKTILDHVFVRSEYKGLSKDLVQMLKFKRVKNASVVIANTLVELIPKSTDSQIIVAIPTASSRRRQRGYDQSILIAKHISKLTGLSYQQFLKRMGQSRQVGTKKSIRQLQMKDAFRVIKSNELVNSRIILIDDVITTGSTLESAAKVLKKAGAKSIDAVVFAKAI